MRAILATECGPNAKPLAKIIFRKPSTKGGHVATCVEIGVTHGAVKVLRMVEAFECGAVIDPEHLRNQIEGVIAMGLGGALFERVEFAGGEISSNRLSRYRVPRFADMRAIESVLLNRKDLTSTGAGERPLATGQRVRSPPVAVRPGATVGRAMVVCGLPTQTTKNDRLRHLS